MNAVAGSELLAPDAWLTETLEVATFALRPAPVTAPQMRTVLDSLGQDRAFVFAKVPAADIAQLRLLESCGFNLVDTLVSLRHRDGASAAAHPAQIRVAAPEERVTVGDIAEGCFRFSRFHQDPKIEPAAANRVKRRWAENCVAGLRGEEVLVASVDGAVVGFLAVVRSGEAAVIDLIGVEPGMQGKGIGCALVHTFVGRWRAKARFLRVGTQISNAASLRLYQRCGFFFEQAQYVLHSHRPEGA